MSGANNSPTPWDLVPARTFAGAVVEDLFGEDVLFVITDKNGLAIAAVYAMDREDPFAAEEAEADGKLLRAAPDMAVALQAFLLAFPHSADHALDAQQREAVKSASAALLKAGRLE